MSGEGLIAEPRAVHQSVGHARLKELMHRGTEFLGCEIAILGGAMSWVSERNLVSAISNAGGFGVIACGAMGPEMLDTEIAATKARTDRPFGVNLITMHPELDELIQVCARHGVGHIVLAGGLPPGWAMEKVKANGAKLIAFAPALALAKKLMRSNADALVIEGMEAGGHIGPVSTSVLAQEILPVVSKDIPVFVAGGIGRGEAIAAYLEMGAVGVQIGTRFVCAHESIAHANFKKAFIRASARDAIPSVQIDPRLPVIPVRALKNREMEKFAAKQREVADLLDRGEIEMAEAQLQIEHYWAGSLRRAVIDGDVETGSVMAGQSVGMVTRRSPRSSASSPTKPPPRWKAGDDPARACGCRAYSCDACGGRRAGRTACRARTAGARREVQRSGGRQGRTRRAIRARLRSGRPVHRPPLHAGYVCRQRLAGKTSDRCGRADAGT
jgi:enoyl-[acyl-carrier protein] reductase II